MSKFPKGRIALPPQTIRLLAFAWIGLMVVAGIVTFVVFLMALNSRSERLAAEAVAQTATMQGGLSAQPTSDPQATPSPGSITATPEGVATQAIAPPSTVGLSNTFELGGQVPGFIAHPDVMRQAGMTWVKFQIKWNPTTDPTLAQDMVNAGHQNGFKVLLSISGDPYPQQIDFASYIAFLEQVAAYQPDAIEVWNEMNLNREWPEGQQSPPSYVTNMLAPAYGAIKAISPSTSVIIGALAPTGLDDGVIAWADARYVQGLAAAGAAEYADCIGVHHNSGTTSPSARTGHVSDAGDGHYSWYFLPTIEVYYEGMNRALPVCLTEFGYFSPDGFPGPVPANFAWGAENTIQEQAAWLAEGAQIAKDLGYIPLMIVWNVDFTKWEPDDPQAGYAILRPDGTCPACGPLRAVVQN